MASILKVTPRPIYKEDLALSTDHSPATVNETVMGVGVVALTPISAVLYSAFGAYANDAAAASAGVNLGEIYYNSTFGKLYARRT